MVKCILYGYRGGSRYKSYHHISENEFYILTKNKKEFEGSIFINSNEDEIELNKVMWEVVKSNDFSYENAKGLINPGNYQEHQEIRDFLKKKKSKK